MQFPMWSRLRSLTAALFRRTRFEDGMADEMRFHLDAYADDLVRAGVAPAEARRRARAEFGGLDAAKEERALASGGEMRVGSNVGKGQMKAADYVLVPDIANKNANSSGRKIGGVIGGLVGGGVGAVMGGVSLKSKTADVVLTLTDVRSTEQVAVVQGHAKKTNLGWGAGAGGYFGAFAAAGASSYSNTEIGQVVAMAYLDAFKKLLAEVQADTPDAKADNAQQAVSMAKPGKLYAKPDLKSDVVRDLDAGMMLYPTGEKSGPWWKVQDELGNEGWVPSALFELAK